MKIAILQSNYIPWKGYFDIINFVDEFILYDSVQYTKNDWRNRNKIKTHQGTVWLTIPVKHSLSLKIEDVEAANQKWRLKHWKTIRQSYAKSAFFEKFSPFFEQIYMDSGEKNLSRINYQFIKLINEILGIRTKISWSSDYLLEGNKSEVLVNICKQAGADTYLSGPAAQNYLDENLFKNQDIHVEWMDYSNYPVYTQIHGAFDHSVSILDLIFNEGPDSIKYMKSFAK